MIQNKRIIWQMSKDYKISYERPSGITKRDVYLASMYMFEGKIMPYTKNTITTEDELDEEITHFYFLNKYNLL